MMEKPVDEEIPISTVKQLIAAPDNSTCADCGAESKKICAIKLNSVI
jgi:hypothetical protein